MDRIRTKALVVEIIATRDERGRLRDPARAYNAVDESGRVLAKVCAVAGKKDVWAACPLVRSGKAEVTGDRAARFAVEQFALAELVRREDQR